MHLQHALWASLFFPSVFSLATPPHDDSPKEEELRHANHIFNTIHSSMRQWGSSLNHNGMSYFLASVPKGVQFYHGTSSSEPVKGMEWLAFEPEHALVFAHPRGPPGRGPPGRGRPPRRSPPEGPRRQSKGGPPHRRPPPPSEHGEGHPGSIWKKLVEWQKEGSHPDEPRSRPPPQKPLGYGMHGKDDRSRSGYLHTYETNKPLRLLYVDGMSAGKTANGTLDSQDMGLLNLTNSGPHGGMWEGERARGLCNMSATEWDNRIDGILRMEMGFEIILCSFQKDLDVVRIAQTGGEGHGGMGNWRYLEAVTSRYWGIGGGRVALDYEHFVTAFTHDIALFDNDVNSDSPMPRLQSASESDLEKLKEEVTSMVLTHDAATAPSTFNWQKTVDMIVSRYSNPLRHLTTSTELRNSTPLLVQYLEDLLRPYLDYAARNSTLETSRCASQFLPPVSPPAALDASLAARAILSVTTAICDTLVTSLYLTSKPQSHAATPPREALKRIDDLVDYLQWTTWKFCPTCPDGELCLIPIWPMGSLEEHREPKCLKQEEAREQHGYWGGRGFGGPPPPPPDGEGSAGMHEHGGPDHPDREHGRHPHWGPPPPFPHDGEDANRWSPPPPPPPPFAGPPPPPREHGPRWDEEEESSD